VYRFVIATNCNRQRALTKKDVKINSNAGAERKTACGNPA